MSETHAMMIEEHRTLLQSLKEFCFGNGNKGANVRLDSIEDIINGNRECNAMKEIRKHMEWHEKMSGRRWEVTVGIILLIIGQSLSLLMMFRK